MPLRRFTTFAAACLVLVVLAGCGDTERVLGDPVASGELADGSLWTVRTADDGAVCARVTSRDGTERGNGCVPLSATWLVGKVEIGNDESVVVAALPSCISALALSGTENRMIATTVSDEIAFGVVGPLRADEEETTTLIAMRFDLSPIFELDRIDDDPSERIPPVAC